MTSSPARGFADSDYQQRCAAVQRQMAQDDIDIALFTSAPEFTYFCGFNTPFWQSPTRPWYLLLPPDGKPVAVIPAIGAALMRQCYAQDIRTWQSPHPTDDGITLLANTLREFAGAGGGGNAGEAFTLGIMAGKHSYCRMPLSEFMRLQNALPAAELRDISGIVHKTRMTKSAAEIAKIAAACAAASAAFSHWHEWLRQDMPLRDIFRRFKIACLQAGADDVPYLIGGCARDGYSDVISPPDERRACRGDVLMLDTGCTYDGYYSDFCRNIAFQHAAEQTRQSYETLQKATDAGLQAASAGATCRQVFHAMHNIITAGNASGGGGDNSSNGDAAVGRYGHGLGIELTEPPSVAAWDDTVLAAGMVITLEPSLPLPGGKMLVHEENIVITNDAPQLLTRRAPPQLPLLP